MSDPRVKGADSDVGDTLFRDDYHDKFSPVVYLRSFWNLEEEWVQFHINNGFKFMRHDAISGSRLLDLGCGPSLINTIAAPDHFTHIGMADYSDANLDVIKQWTRGLEMGFDWDNVCHYYSQKHKLGPLWEKTRLATLKSYIKDVVHCDVQQSEPLGPTYTAFFDCIVSAYCLEVASRNIEGYNQSVKNTATLLRYGGHLVMRGAVNEKCYIVDGKSFHTFPLTAQQLTAALEGAGLKAIEIKFEVDGDPKDITTNTGFCLLAQKVKT